MFIGKSLHWGVATMVVLLLLKRIRSHKHLYCQLLAKEPDVLTGLLKEYSAHINSHTEDH